MIMRLINPHPAQKTAVSHAPVFVATPILMLTLMLVGCNGPMESLDRQAADVLAKRQMMTLGEQTADHQDLIPPTPASKSKDQSLYQTQPKTINPATDQLPATQAPTVEGESQAPEVLDPTGDDALTMDLPAILGYAIAHSREYRNRKEELFLAALDLLGERHLWGPRFFNDFTARFTGTPEAGDHDHVSDLVNEFRITQRLPYGGDISVSALVNLVNVLHNGTGLDPEQSQSAELNLSATLPLLRGAGQVAREDLIQSERDLVYAARSFERFRREFFVDIATDYFRLIAQAEGIDNQKMQMQGLNHLARRFRALVEADRAAPFESEQAQADATFALNNYVIAQEDYAASLDAFKIRIGLPVTQALVVAPMDLQAPEPVLDLAAAVLAGRQYRLDLQTRADQVDDAHRGAAVSKNALLPDLELFADVRVPTTSRLDNAGAQFSLEDGRYDAGVRFGAPLDRRLEWIAYRRSLINLERAHRSYTLQSDQMAQQVRSSIRGIRQARFSLQLQERNVELAIRRKRSVEIEEELGKLQPREVIEAEEDLLEARNRRDGAVRDLRISILRFLLDTGQMRIGSDGRWNPPVKLAPLNQPEPPNNL